tara:strand:- start:913 stop:1299 length:387 start_codon:yes stop_codon:yes gene_type:complete
MENEFIPYEQALALKELGFNEPCFGLYAPPSKTVFLHHYGLLSAKEQILAPLYQQAFRWFREKYNLRGFIGFRPNVKQFDCHIYDMSLSGKEYTEQRTMEEFNKDPKVGTYEEAELECLKKLISIVKQ